MEKHIQDLHEELGIPDSYAQSCGLEYCRDCESLVEAEADVFGRQPQLEKSAFAAWQAMQSKARIEGVELQIVSAYRSADYQADLFRKKITRGDKIEDILKVNAAPGYSEHHSGCALDITTPGVDPLIEAFENSAAFDWLCRNAGSFGFSMSFPRDNASGMAYEPWHWKYTHDTKKAG